MFIIILLFLAAAIIFAAGAAVAHYGPKLGRNVDNVKITEDAIMNILESDLSDTDKAAELEEIKFELISFSSTLDSTHVSSEDRRIFMVSICLLKNLFTREIDAESVGIFKLCLNDGISHPLVAGWLNAILSNHVKGRKVADYMGEAYKRFSHCDLHDGNVHWILAARYRALRDPNFKDGVYQKNLNSDSFSREFSRILDETKCRPFMFWLKTIIPELLDGPWNSD